MFQSVVTARKTNNAKEAIREYANTEDVCVEPDIFYLILNVMQVSLKCYNRNRNGHLFKPYQNKLQTMNIYTINKNTGNRNIMQ